MTLNSMDFKILQVGKPFDLFKGVDCTNMESGCIFEALHGGDYALMVYMNNMHEEEKELLRTGKIQVKVMQEGDFLLNLFRFGNSPLIFESSFDVTLYKQINDERMDTLGVSNMLHVIGIESSDNTVQTLRQVSITPNIFLLWIDMWNKALNTEDFSRKYKAWVNDLDNRYSLLKLWEYGKYVGKLGV